MLTGGRANHRIQACYKGHMVRVAYKSLRRTIPYKVCLCATLALSLGAYWLLLPEAETCSGWVFDFQDPRLKRRWLEERIQEQSAALVKEVEEDRGDLDSFFAELDASVAASKAQMEQAEASFLRRRAPSEGGQSSSNRLVRQT
jgi:hypothetical protein